MILRAGVLALAVLSCSAHADGLEWPLVPDRELTPGAPPRSLTVDQICRTKWGKDERAVTWRMKEQVFRAYFARYGARPRHLRNGRPAFEVDHDLSRELGGADVIENLWVEQYVGEWNARMKDRLENRLHTEVCAGRLPLPDAQQMIVDDWRAAYVRYFGQPK